MLFLLALECFFSATRVSWTVVVCAMAPTTKEEEEDSQEEEVEEVDKSKESKKEANQLDSVTDYCMKAS